MNKLKLACIATLLSAGISHASTPCDGFEIKIKNQLSDNLIVSKIYLNGAEIQPGGIQKIDAKTEQVFIVNKSADNVPMAGNLIFHSISLPSKEVKIQFDLKNSGVVCEHSDRSPEGDYAVDKTRLPGKVNYTIANK